MAKPAFGPNIAPNERRPVAWHAPAVLWQAARKLLAAEQFATHLDRRETIFRWWTCGAKRSLL